MTLFALASRRVTSVVGLLLSVCGCSPAYHAYPCGRDPYPYRFRPPPPYEVYEGCPTPVAHCCLGGFPPPAEAAESLPLPTVEHRLEFEVDPAEAGGQNPRPRSLE